MESGAERLKKLRISYELTQEQMAEELDISVSLYKNIEQGKSGISRKTANAIEKRFHISADSFYYGTLRDGTELWDKIYECDDIDKMKIMFRLINYFASQYKFPEDEENIQKLILNLLKKY